MTVAFRGTVRRWSATSSADSPSSTSPPPSSTGTAADARCESLEHHRRAVHRQHHAGGSFCIGVSRAAVNAAGAAVGDQVDLSIAPAS